MSAQVTTAPGRGPDTVHGAASPLGSITVEDGVLRLVGEIDADLCTHWTTSRPADLEVLAVDARRVTFLSCAGLGLLFGVAHGRAGVVPLWAGGRAVLRPMAVTGVADLFDLRPA